MDIISNFSHYLKMRLPLELATNEDVASFIVKFERRIINPKASKENSFIGKMENNYIEMSRREEFISLNIIMNKIMFAGSIDVINKKTVIHGIVKYEPITSFLLRAILIILGIAFLVSLFDWGYETIFYLLVNVIAYIFYLFPLYVFKRNVINELFRIIEG